MKKQIIHSTFVKMSSERLLAKVLAGTMNKQEAKVAATIIEKRFPTRKN